MSITPKVSFPESWTRLNKEHFSNVEQFGKYISLKSIRLLQNPETGEFILDEEDAIRFRITKSISLDRSAAEKLLPLLKTFLDHYDEHLISRKAWVQKNVKQRKDDDDV